MSVAELIENQNRWIQAVALDMDGLTLNTEDLYEEVGHALMARRGKHYRDDVRRRMTGLPAPQAFGVLIEAEGLSDSWQQLLAESAAMFDGILADRVQPMPGLMSLLDELDRLSLPRCIATSSTRTFAETALGFAGVLPRIDFVLTAADVPQGKPAPDIYLLAASRMGTTADRMLVLEDSSIGSQAGIRAGAHVISVPSRHTLGSDFRGANHVATCLQDKVIYATLDARVRH
ncbi:MAG: HAD-IA family hydrolase [Pirellulaceae bacterium]|nr:HAD-IA family hydrolase [Pirellulaceae bacterium]